MDKQQQELLARALESAANAILITDRDGHILWLNDAMCRLCGYSKQEVLGLTPHLFYSGQQDAAFYRDLWETILAGRPWQGVMVERRKDGTRYTVSQVITPLVDASGAITHFISIQHDVTTREQEGEKARWLAYHDVLTGLPNRALFLDWLGRAIAQASDTHSKLAVLFIDLDHFKEVNDTLGHAAGDQLLITVAERLSGAVRQSDIVARLGGDEFTILLYDIKNHEVASTLATKLVELISQPFVINDLYANVSVSVGISLYPTDANTGELLLHQADVAMYQAKTAGRHCYRFFAQPESAPNDQTGEK
jgi:diguanylate cyclase (GGDEF)-like protein/PAS domain S-box-containing protein